MRKTKRRLETLSFYDHTGISAHLEKMAAKGWMLERVANYGWIYRRMEPRKLHFAVCYYPKASEYDRILAQARDYERFFEEGAL